ncbi:hypothetical protein BH09SUM1_BH09SUM1_28330 [soil metagenome]
MATSNDPASDVFGKVVVGSTYLNATAGNAIAVVMNSDLSLAGGYSGTYASRLIKGTGDATNATGVGGGNALLWGLAFDPLSLSTLYSAGQTTVGSEFSGATLSSSLPAAFADADNGVNTISNPRDVAVNVYSGSKFAYICRGATVTRYPMTGTTITAAATGVDIIGTITGITYAKDVEFDPSGNMYWATQVNNILYRWNSATVSGAVAGTLVGSNTTWTITMPGTERAMFVKVSGAGTPGGPRVFVATTLGVYDLGLASQATKTLTLTVPDRIITITTPLYGAQSTSYSTPIAADYVGNVSVGDRTNEHVRTYSPGGNTSIPVTAPPSQNFSINSAISDWSTLNDQ